MIYIVIAVVALLALLVSSLVISTRKRRAAKASKPSSDSAQMTSVMTPGFENRFDQPYSIYTTQVNSQSSAGYANQPPPGPPPEHSYKPELLSGFPAEAPPAYGETEFVQAPLPSRVLS